MVATTNRVSDIVELINNIFKVPVLPMSEHLLDKLFNPNNSSVLHAKCPKCKSYAGQAPLYAEKDKERSIKCKSCAHNVGIKNLHESGFFATFDIKNDVKQLIENNGTYYEHVVNVRQPSEVINDIYDGKKYKEFLNELNEDDRKSYATAIFNADGSPVFNSSTLSIWPFQIVLNEIPMEERLKNVLLCGLWFGKQKPDMDIYLEPVVQYFKELSNTGIPCKVVNDIRNIKIHLVCCCVDSAARPSMQGLKSFNGHYGCSWCLHPGRWSYSCHSLKYHRLDDFPEERTQLQALDDMDTLLRTKKKCVNGFTHVSVLNKLDHFDIIDGFTVDYMHNVLLGVSRQFAKYWFSDRRKDYSLADDDIQAVNTALLNIKTHSQVGHVTRQISERKYWSARDWENWTLYYSVPVLTGVLPEIYMKHWSCLVGAIYILLQREINFEQLNKSSELLHEFVFDAQDLYGIQAMTYNVHQLLHLTASVYNWGPLWCHNGYPFENGNGELLKTIHAANGVIHQTCRFLNLQKSFVFILSQETYRNCSPYVNRYLDQLTCKKKRKITHKTDVCSYFGKSFTPNTALINNFNLSTSRTRAYKRIVLNKCLYASSDKENQRSNNSFAVLNDNRFILCKQFVCDTENCKDLAIVQFVNTCRAFEEHSEFQKIVSIQNELSVIYTEDILKPCIEIKQNDVTYVIPVTNTYHF